jgi:ceramide glucosyltransferase
MLTILAILLTSIYFLDRTWKVATIAHFFRQAHPPEPELWPTLSLIQPVTTSPNDLKAVLTRRAQVLYPGKLEQIIVFDAGDGASQALCHDLMEQFPTWRPKIVLATGSAIALKTVKQLAGLEQATSEVICFVDDDILLRPETLPILVRYLQPGIGSTFGLACYTNRQNIWGGLMSAFVNANVLLNYIPITYLTDPYTITGHIYALRRTDFDAIGGLTGMAQRLDDDHELARRVIRGGLLNCQTPAIYDVDNQLSTLTAFLAQMKRWFVFPRETMLPHTSRRQRILTMADSLPNILPGIMLLVALFQPTAWLALAVCLLAFYAAYAWGTYAYLKQPTPLRSWPLLLLVGIILPFLILFLLFGDSTIQWRGQKIHVKRGGECEIIN